MRLESLFILVLKNENPLNLHYTMQYGDVFSARVPVWMQVCVWIFYHVYLQNEEWKFL